MSKLSMLEQFKAARRAGTPLLAINCFDPEATIQAVQASLNGKADETSIIQWDIIRGFRPRNEKAKASIASALKEAPIEASQNPVEALEIASRLPERSIVFMYNAHHHLNDKPKPDFVQALWNLRDQFKADKRSVVLLSPGIQLPTELQQDVVILDEALPTEEQIQSIIHEICDPVLTLDDELLHGATDALRGISAFPAEQAVAMSISKVDGKAILDVEQLWDRKRQLINSTPGLSVWQGGQKFDDIGGLDEIKSRFARIIAGKKPPKVVVWIDEIEKAMAGADSSGGDSSGTTQDQLGVLLTEMQDKEYGGSLFVGVPGAAKSAFAKAVANEAGILTIKLDLGELKGQFVGQSEERIRQAMKIIEAVGGVGGAFFIATSNDIRVVKPELKRRFKKGIWFFDLPTKSERQVIWQIFLKKFNLNFKVADIDFDNNWTGAEIETCCQTAWEEDCTLQEVALGIIPVAVSGKLEVERLRNEANGKYNSVIRQGAYVTSDTSLDDEFVQPRRSMEL